MDKETQQHYSPASLENNQTRIQLSLAALMFFSPLVQNVIKKTNMELSESDKTFIKWYIRFGYVALIILAIVLITWLTNYRLELGFINRIYTISIVGLTIVLVIGTIGILTNTNILTGKKELLSLYNEQITTDKKNILLTYTPILNIYQRYQEHDFEKPNILLKESLVVWWIFIALGLLTTPWRTSTFLIIIIIRVASLMGEMDIISPQIKAFINKLFLKNPEELRWYIRWSITYAYRRLAKTSQWDINMTISHAKQEFSLLYNIQLENSVIIKTQYAIGILCAVLLIRQTNRNLLERTKLIPLLILLGRYVVMLFKRHHLPPLPIFKEITDAGLYLYEKIKKHSNK